MIITFKLIDNTKMYVIADCSSKASLREMAISYSQNIFNQRKFVLTSKSEIIDFEKWSKEHNSKNLDGQKWFSIAVVYKGQIDIRRINAGGPKSAYNNFKFMTGIDDEVFAFIYDESQVVKKKSALAASRCLMSDRNKTNQVLNQAVGVLKQIDGIGEYAEDLSLLFNMIKDYQNGSYKQAPMNTMVKTFVVILYFVSPVNLSFEAIPVIGQFDDIMLLTWLLRGAHADIQNYKQWLIENKRYNG